MDQVRPATVRTRREDGRAPTQGSTSSPPPGLRRTRRSSSDTSTAPRGKYLAVRRILQIKGINQLNSLDSVRLNLIFQIEHCKFEMFFPSNILFFCIKEKNKISTQKSNGSLKNFITCFFQEFFNQS